MKEKKKRVEDSVCKFCRRPVGLARAFARGPEGVACLRHPGVLEIWLRDGSPTLFIKRADPTTRDGKWLTVDVPSFLKSKNLLPGSNEANRALKSLVFNVAGGSSEDSPRPAGLALESKHSDRSTSPSLGREKGKGGVGGGWGLFQAFESEAELSQTRPQEKVPRRYENLFRDLIEDERAQLQKIRRRQLKTKGLRAAAVEGSR